MLKTAVPLLAVCDHNLLPCCSRCNKAPNKGTKAVHTAGNFANWYHHPYLRHPGGALQLAYDDNLHEVTVTSAQGGDGQKVVNLYWLLNLRVRWTREFLAENTKIRGQIAELRRRGRGPNTTTKVVDWLSGYRDSLRHSEPNFEVHFLVAAALLDPDMIAALSV